MCTVVITVIDGGDTTHGGTTIGGGVAGGGVIGTGVGEGVGEGVGGEVSGQSLGGGAPHDLVSFLGQCLPTGYDAYCASRYCVAVLHTSLPPCLTTVHPLHSDQRLHFTSFGQPGHGDGFGLHFRVCASGHLIPQESGF
jgi:hypothetical protein